DADFVNDLRTIAEFKNPLYGSVTEFNHYTQLPAFFGGIENMSRRQWIPRSEYNPEEGPVRVPYVACYDEFRDATGTCHTWDQGADLSEIAANYISQYENYYVFNNFQRDRLGFQPGNVLNRVASRYFLPLT